MDKLINRVLNMNEKIKSSENIIHFSKLKKSASYRDYISEKKFIFELNNLIFYFSDLYKYRINIMMSAYLIACYYEKFYKYDHAVAFYKLSANFGHPMSSLCLVTLYYQIDDIESYNYYKSKIDLFFKILEVKPNAYVNEVKNNYKKLNNVEKEIDAMRMLEFVSLINS
jgi:hypothetical protein